MAKMPGLWRRAQLFARHSTPRQKLATPLLVAGLGLARAMVLTLPFKTYVPILGQLADDNAGAAEPARSDGFRAQRIGKLIEAVASFTPWNSNCLAQAIVASLCLRVLGIGYSVHFGVAPKGGIGSSVEAHSWVMAGEHPVTGFEGSIGLTCLRTFRLSPS